MEEHFQWNTNLLKSIQSVEQREQKVKNKNKTKASRSHKSVNCYKYSYIQYMYSTYYNIVFIQVHKRSDRERERKKANGNLKWQKHCECNCDATHCAIINDINAAMILLFNFSIRLFFHKFWTIFCCCLLLLLHFIFSFVLNSSGCISNDSNTEDEINEGKNIFNKKRTFCTFTLNYNDPSNKYIEW